MPVLEQAITLIQRKKHSFRVVSAACGVTVSSIQHGLKAKEENRAVGVKGRPKLLNDADEQELHRLLVSSASAGSPMTTSELRHKVRYVLTL